MSEPRVRPAPPSVEHAGERLITSDGRPPEPQLPRSWGRFVIRLLSLIWGAAVVLAVIDELGPVPHLTFLMAMGMTGLLVAAAFLFTHDDSDREARDRQRDDRDADAANDELTGLPAYGFFARRLTDEFGRARRIGRQLSVVLIDVNNLTAVNKEYGVRAGDEVLRHVGRMIEQTKRFSDVAARLGDDEFGVILLDTGEVGVDSFIQRLEDRLARESAQAEVQDRSISLWAGVCTGSAILAGNMSSADQVLQEAMGSLNGAKQDRERRRRMWMSA